MSLNPDYMIAPSLQEFFIDNQTQLPMAGGTVTFYSDVNRSTLKNIYTLNGSAPNYSYDALPNPVTLSGVGTIMDANGNDVLPYYFPFDSEGNVELYYIVVKNSSGVQQFTRQAYPNFIQGGNEAENLKNYVPNGQFLAHMIPPQNPGNTPLPTNQIGQIPSTQPITIVAQGGWTFERPNPSTSTDFVTFDVIGATNIPTSNPRYAIKINNTSPGTDSFKYLGLQFPNVNKFSTPSPVSPQEYTFGFSARTNNGGTQTVQMYVRKFFGSGGSSTTTDPVGSPITINQNYAPYTITINFGNNIGQNIGSGGDDYVQILFGLSPSVNMSITDVFLTPGADIETTFPIETDAEMLSKSVAGWIPTPDPTGLDNYLPMVLTPKGAKFDHSIVGTVTANAINAGQTTPPAGWVLCNGAQYYTNGYDNTVDPITGFATDIPYARLQTALFNKSLAGGTPIFGTGENFSTAALGTIYGASLTTTFFLNSNSAGNFTTAANGTTSPGIIFAQTVPGISAASMTVTAYMLAGSTILIVSNSPGPVAINIGATNNTTGWTVSQNRGTSTSSYFGGYSIAQIDITAYPTANSYLTFSSPTVNYFIDFGSNDVGGYVRIPVSLPAGLTNAGIAQIVTSAINGFHQDIGVCPAGSAIPQASWFQFYNTGANGSNFYYCWFNKNGSTGIDPKPSGGVLGIQIPYIGTETASEIAQKIIYQTSNGINYGINTIFFAVPDLRGKFIRASDSNAGFDNLISRLSNPTLPYFNGNAYGSLEYDDVILHTHNLPNPIKVSSIQITAGAGVGGVFVPNTSASTVENIDTSNATNTITVNNNVDFRTGGYETRPVNMELSYWIHL